MKKMFLGAGLFLLGMTISCTSCSKKEETIVVAPSSTTTMPIVVEPLQLIQNDHWQFLAPFDWQKIESIEPGVEALVINEKSNELILLAKEYCSASAQLCIDSSIESLKLNGAQIVSVNKVDINNMQYWLIKSVIDGLQVSAWVTIANGSAFIFSCGGKVNEDHLACDKIVQTLILK